MSPIKWTAISSKQRSCRYSYMDAPHRHWQNGWRKSLTAITQECLKQYWRSLRDSTPQSSSNTATYHPSRKLSKSDEPHMRDNAGVVGTSLWVINYCGPLHMDVERQDVQFTPRYSSSVPIRDIALRIYRKQWTIGKCGERSSGIYVLIAWHDIYIYIYIYNWIIMMIWFGEIVVDYLWLCRYSNFPLLSAMSTLNFS